MPDLLVTVSISRDNLALPALLLEDFDSPAPSDTRYRVVNFGPGEKAMKQQWAEAPWIEGKYLTSSVKEQREMRLVGRCYFTSMLEMQNRYQELEAAFSQFIYELSVELTYPGGDSATGVWQAYAAPSLSMGDAGSFNPQALRSGIQEFVVTIPVLPTPISGGF